MITSVVLTIASVASAVTCTISGVAKVEPLDAYYCDTNQGANCSGWLVTDLDAARGASAKPMPYMRIEIWQGSTFLAKTHSGASGTYSVSFTLPGASCTGQSVTIQHWMERIHESDLGVSPPRYRFAIVAYQQELWPHEEQMLTRWKLLHNVSLTGSTTNVSVTWTAVSDPGLTARLANMYFTLNAAISEYKGWSSNLSSQFAHTSGGANGITRVIYGPGYTGIGGGTNPQNWHVIIRYDSYNRGEIARHELGHLVREGIHQRQCIFPGNCVSENYNYSVGYSEESCEYGPAAFNEGVADFFAVRSATYNDTNVWGCTCADNNNQDICSETSNVMGAGVGRLACTGGRLVGVGDRWIVNSNWCTRVREALGCSGCAQDASGYCLYPALYGWRNYIQVQRFLWDLIDTSSDGGYDDTDLSIGQLVALMEGMPTGNGVDGSCYEPNRSSPSQCNPATDGAPVTGGTGSRDSYNTRDISDLVGGDLSWEQSINCVLFATDN